jgi:hypothetical protein
MEERKGFSNRRRAAFCSGPAAFHNSLATLWDSPGVQRVSAFAGRDARFA